MNTEIENEDSFNETEVENEDSFNTETEVEIEDSFNEDTEIENDDSFNDNSINTDLEVEVEDSMNDSSDNSIRNQDAFNVTSTFTTQTLNEFSSTVGVRQYNSGFGDIDLGGVFGMSSPFGMSSGKFGGGGGDLEVDNRSMQLDQSVNQSIVTGDGSGVSQFFGQTANVAFGDESMAAGRDVFIDNSEVEYKAGSVSIGNTEIETEIEDSFNDFSNNFTMEVDYEVEDSFNNTWTSIDTDTEIEDSFTSEIDSAIENSYEWENSGNLFSPDSAATGGENVDVF